jgi:hypothetical protein
VNHHFNRRWLHAGWAALLLLQVGCFVFYLNRLHYLPGTDAYYYALQAQSLLDSGHLKVSEGDAVPYLIAAVSRLGISLEICFKSVIVAIYAIYTIGFLLLLVRLKDKTRTPAMLLWLVGSSVVAFHTIEFPKLSLGLALVPIWFCLIASELKTRILWLLFLLVISSLIHPALISLAFVFILTVALGKKKSEHDGKQGFQIRGLTFGFIGSGLLVVAIAVLRSGVALRLASLRIGPPGLFSLVRAEGVPFDLKLVAFFFWVLLAFLFCDSLLTRSGKWIYVTAATLALPFWPDQESGLFGVGGRLAAMFVFLAMPLTLLVWDELGERSIFFSWLQVSWANQMFGLVAIVVLAYFPARLRGYDDLLVSKDYATYEKVVAALRHDDIPMLIAHRGLDFFYSYRLKRDAFHFDPEPDWNRTDIWRVAVRITPEESVYYSPPTCAWGETARAIPGTDYLLIREDCWEQLRAGLNPNDNPDLYMEVWQDMDNPSQPRPAFLRAKHRNDAGPSSPAYVEADK